MNKVVVDSSFFDLDSPLSSGLISGLKKLTRKNILVETDYIADESMKKIFSSEDIQLYRKNEFERAIENIYFITSDNVGSSQTDNNIRVNLESEVNSFEKAANQVLSLLRSSNQHRRTKETDITISLCLDGEGKSSIDTGIGFFDHMLEQIARHANIDLNIYVDGDLFVDEHHTVEDTGITLGIAISEALGNRKGIRRYGFFLPMDDTIARAALDLGGRSYLNFKCKFKRDRVGDFPTELTEEFFRGLASGLKANLYLRSKGKNDHHKIESLFKVFAKTLNEACRIDERNPDALPSTKGVI